MHTLHGNGVQDCKCREAKTDMVASVNSLRSNVAERRREREREREGRLCIVYICVYAECIL